MDEKIRLGLVGLGSICRKAYMPVLAREIDWVLSGCYARTPETRKAFSEEYRVKAYDTLEELSENIDAVVINSSTESHFELAKFFLDKGIHVLIDKPLASSTEECEKLVFSSVNNKAKLMVTFNRRFAPLYKMLKNNITSTSLIRIVKNRADRIGPETAEFTINDDYIHLVDTARWFFDGKLIMIDGDMAVNGENHLIYAHHYFRSPEGCKIETLLHRDSGKTKEMIEVINEGKTITVIDLATLVIESENETRTVSPSQWATVEKTKGFEDAIKHFVSAIILDKEPESSGMEALATQRVIDSIIQSN
ncbi:MAG: Gfo/Idh/MocA family oxidoreductase [Clostridiaceae bacterium]